MKQLYKYIAITFIIGSSVSCSFLEERQPTGLLETYSTKEMLEASCSGILEGCYGAYGIVGEPHEYFTYGSGLWHFTPTTSSKLKNYKYLAPLRFGMYSDVAHNTGLYQSIFGCINCCNVLIDNLPNSPVDKAYKDQIEAEARFYRGVFYLTAVRLWGDLPLRVGSVTADNASGIKRSPYYQIYSQIVEDLQAAEKGMRTPEQVRAITPGTVRVNKYAATAFLARTYLVIGSLLHHPDDNFWDSSKEGRIPDFKAIGIDGPTLEDCSKQAYAKALEYAEKLIPESGISIPECEYRLVDNFGELFDYGFTLESTGDYNSEQIFIIPISASSLLSAIAQHTLPKHPENSKSLDPLKGNGNNGRYRPNRFLFRHWCLDNGPVYCSSDMTGTAECIDCGDPRMKHSLFYSEIIDIASESSTVSYPMVTKCGNEGDVQVYPYLKKYNSSTYNMNNGTANYYYMRFAELYYIAAEAAAFVTGNPNNAKTVQYMECIHSRARKSVPNGQPEAAFPDWRSKTFSSLDEFETAMFWDRMYEFLGEGQEWEESHRHGATWIAKNLGEPLNECLDLPENAKLKATTWAYPAGFRYETDPKILRCALLASIPQEAIMYSTEIKYEDQNDFFYQ